MLEIRKARPDDALGIMIVNVYTWQTAYGGLLSPATLDARIRGLPAKAEKLKAELLDKNDCLVATVDGTVIGFCLYGRSRNERFEDAGEINALYVLEGYHGRKIGKALFQVGVRELEAEGLNSIILNCLRGNPAIGFYQHMGGKIVGERRDALSDDTICEDILYFADLTAISRGR